MKKNSQDRFAEIALATQTIQDDLVEPQPILKKHILLPSSADQHNPKAAFKFEPYMASQEAFEKELYRLRRKMDVFLQDFAPELKPCRKSIELKTFNYRLSTKQDYSDLKFALSGKGVWQQVEIPHYGGPVGRATAFYQTTFQVNGSYLKNKTSWVCFSGVDYKCDVYINGNYVGSHEGFFSRFEFNISQYIKTGKNILFVKVDNDAIFMGSKSPNGSTIDGDKLYAATGVGWDEPGVGWHHCPPGMGVWQPVKIEFRSPIHICDIFVQPDIKNQSVTAHIEVENTQFSYEDFGVSIRIFGQNFKKTVLRSFHNELKAGPGKNRYAFELPIPKARIWQLHSPWLYQIQVELLKDDKTIDAQKRHFGMRSFRLDTECTPKGQFYLNGERIKLRGANTMGHMEQCLVKGDTEQLIKDILIAKIANLNFYRLTQRPVNTEIYDLCDKLGILLQTDLPLFAFVRWNKYSEVIRQSEEMERHIRNHPSNIMVTFINEPFPDYLTKRYRYLMRKELLDLLEAASIAVRFANPDRVIKPVDGDYSPPAPGLPDNHCYTLWYNAHSIPVGKLNQGYWVRVKDGWNYACGEYGVEGLDHLDTMKKLYPKKWLPKQLNSEWSPLSIPYAQSGKYSLAFFASPRTLKAWVEKSQQWQAWAVEFMTEAFRRDPRMISFALHLLIDAFPAGWMKAVVDVQRKPKPAYFAFRHALTPLAANIQFDRFSYFAGEKTDIHFWICNDTLQADSSLAIRYQLKLDKKILFSKSLPAKIQPMEPSYQGTLRYKLPPVKQRTPLNVELAITDKTGKIIHNTRKTFEIFPKYRKVNVPSLYAFGIRPSTKQLINNVSLSCASWNGERGTIVVDSLDQFVKNRHQLYQVVKQGSTVILTEFTPAPDQNTYKDFNPKTYTFTFGKYPFAIEPLGFNDRYFVDSSTDHPIVRDFKEEDFRFWYNAHTKRIDPIARYCIRSETLKGQSILVAAKGDWGVQTEWPLLPVAAEYSIGRGKLIISTLALDGYVQKNPPAFLFFQRLLNA